MTTVNAFICVGGSRIALWATPKGSHHRRHSVGRANSHKRSRLFLCAYGFPSCLTGAKDTENGWRRESVAFVAYGVQWRIVSKIACLALCLCAENGTESASRQVDRKEFISADSIESWRRSSPHRQKVLPLTSDRSPPGEGGVLFGATIKRPSFRWHKTSLSVRGRFPVETRRPLSYRARAGIVGHLWWSARPWLPSARLQRKSTSPIGAVHPHGRWGDVAKGHRVDKNVNAGKSPFIRLPLGAAMHTHIHTDAMEGKERESRSIYCPTWTHVQENMIGKKRNVAPFAATPSSLFMAPLPRAC